MRALALAPSTVIFPKGLGVALVEDGAAWEAISEPWDRVAEGLEAFYLSYPWLRSWWDTYGSGRLALPVVWQGGRVVAFAPWCRRRGWHWGLPVRKVENLFNAHAVRSDVGLAGPEAESLALVLDAIDREPWDAIVLCEIPLRSKLLRHLPELCRRRGLRLRWRRSLSSPYVTIRGSWEDFLRTRSARFRKNLRNKMNRLSASGLTARFECVRGRERVGEILPEVMSVAARSWTGQRGSSIDCPANRGFYEVLIRRMAARDGLCIPTLRLDGRLAAFEIHVLCGRRRGVIKASYDPDFAVLSPGSLLDAHIVEGLFRSGECDRYDLLGKVEFHKLCWTEEAEDHAEVFVFSGRPLSRALELLEFGLRPRLGSVKRRLKRLWGRKPGAAKR